jgi:IS5 family transposase
VVNKKTGLIISVHIAKGKKHDFKMFKESRLPIGKDTQIQADSGYQGIQKLHANCQIPHKKKKKQPLTKAQKKENRLLSASRVLVENVIRKVKIFRIVAEKYRNRRKRFGLRLNLIAAICNIL